MAGTPIKFEIVKHIGVINRNDFDKTGDWERCRGVPEWIRIVSFASVWAARFGWEYKQTSL